MKELLLNEITHGNTTYITSEPLKIEFSIEDGIVTAENKKLKLLGFGKDNKFDAVESFKEEFDFIYRRYNGLTNDKLTKEVIDIKNELNRIVKEVVTIKTNKHERTKK